MALPSDAIVTGPGEARSITLGRDILELYPSTAITIDTHGEKTTVNLLTATVRTKVAKRKQTGLFEVRTLWLVATVKGTLFEVSTANDASAVSVYEGRVALKAANGTGATDITPGKTGTVSVQDKGAKVGDTPRGGAAAAAKRGQVCEPLHTD
jgi:ferric-dicitrate binding protein FerR (iron transport regulator)